MLKDRPSRRDTVPHSGTSRIRSTSPDKRNIPAESIQLDENKPGRGIYPSPITKMSMSTADTSIEARSVMDQACTSQEQIPCLSTRISRRDLVYSPAIMRSKSADSRPTERHTLPEGHLDLPKLSSDCANRPTALPSMEHVKGYEFMQTNCPRTKHQLEEGSQSKRKYKQQRKQKDQQTVHKYTDRHRPRHAKQTDPETWEGQDPPIDQHGAQDSNRNAISPGGETDEEGRSRRVPLMTRLWQTLLCSTNHDGVQPTITGNSFPEFRSQFQLFLTARQNTDDRQSGMSHYTSFNITNKEIQDLMEEYLMNLDTLGLDLTQQDCRTLTDIWRENEQTINNNALNQEAIDRETDGAMELYYFTQSVKEEQVRKTVQHKMIKAKLELEMIRDMSRCIDEIMIGDKDLNNERQWNPENETAEMNREEACIADMYKKKYKVNKVNPVEHQVKLKHDGHNDPSFRFDDGDIPIPPAIFDMINLSEERELLKEKISHLRLEEEKKQTRKRLALRIDANHHETSNNSKAIQEDMLHEGDTGQNPVKKPVAFVIDMEGEENVRTEQNRRKPDFVAKSHHEVSNKYRDEHKDLSEIDKEKKHMKKAVAFVIDMEDEEAENQIQQYKRDISFKTKKKHTNGNTRYEASNKHQAFMAKNRPQNTFDAFETNVGGGEDTARKHKVTWQNRHFENQKPKKVENTKRLNEFENYEPQQTKPTFQMILQSRLKLQDMYNKQNTVSRKVSVNNRPKPFKANYNEIKSKIQTRFTDRDADAINKTAIRNNPNNRPSTKINNYDGIKSKIQTRFPDRNDAVSKSAVYGKDPNNSLRSVKQNYNGIKSKIQTRFPDRKVEEKNCVITKKEPNYTKQSYAGIKSKIKTRFSSRNNACINNAVIDYGPNDRLKPPLKQGCNAIKSTFPTSPVKLCKRIAVSANELPKTYQRPIAKKASKLPLSKSMMQKKEKYRLKPKRQYRSKADLSITKFRTENTLEDRTMITASSLDKSFPQTRTVNKSDYAFDYGTGNQKMSLEERPRMSSQKVDIPSHGRSVTTVEMPRSNTPKQAKAARHSKSPFTAKRLKSSHDLSDGNAGYEGGQGQACLSPHPVLPPIAPREQNNTSDSQSQNLKQKLPPIRRTPTPSYLHLFIPDGYDVTGQSPSLSQKLPPIRHTPPPPSIHSTTPDGYGGNRVVSKSAMNPSPNLHPNLPPIRHTPTPPRIHSTTPDGYGGNGIVSKSAMNSSPNLHPKLPPIRHTPSPTCLDHSVHIGHYSQGDIQGGGGFTAKFQLARTSSPGHNTTSI